jgi:cytoskeletal protein RodZ
MGVFGETLRQARAYKGVTLKEAEQATRINRHHLAALEDENFAALPPLIYQRGIVRNYAMYLDLDPNKILSMFEEAHGAASAPTDVVIAMKPLDMPNNFTPNFAVIAFLCVLSAILFAWLYSVYRGPSDTLPTSTVPITVTPIATQAETTPISATATATATSESSDNVAAAGDQAAGVPSGEAARPLSEANRARTQVAQRAAQEVQATVPSEPVEVAQEATVAPTATATITPTPDRQATQEAAAAQTQEALAAQQTQAAIDAMMLTISFTPSDWVYLTVYADGVLVYADNAAPGTTIGPFDAVSFDVYTSNAEVTNITNHDTGQTFIMGSGELSFTLP